ncbi:MAG TPA: hypothetical protein VFG09_00600 [Thermodesulfovibrionales bacterium]|jgi:hypothetical protein|nr:hypothetical protein [Thermodesulfovibrionales bacterium]
MRPFDMLGDRFHGCGVLFSIDLAAAVVAFLFVAAMLAFIGALLAFLREILIALKAGFGHFS